MIAFVEFSETIGNMRGDMSVFFEAGVVRIIFIHSVNTE